MRRLVACSLTLGLLLGIIGLEAQAAERLSIKRAESAAYNLTRKVGEQEGAGYALAGYCKRKSATKVNCWGALVHDDGTAAAQRITVAKGRRVKAKRYGSAITGDLSGSGYEGGGVSDEWAVCSPSGFCAGS